MRILRPFANPRPPDNSEILQIDVSNALNELVAGCQALLQEVMRKGLDEQTRSILERANAVLRDIGTANGVTPEEVDAAFVQIKDTYIGLKQAARRSAGERLTERQRTDTRVVTEQTASSHARLLALEPHLETPSRPIAPDDTAFDMGSEVIALEP